MSMVQIESPWKGKTQKHENSTPKLKTYQVPVMPCVLFPLRFGFGCFVGELK